MPEEKAQLVTGTVTLKIAGTCFQCLKKVSRTVLNSGIQSFDIKPQQNKVILKGKDIDIEKILSQLKKVEKFAEIEKIEKEPPPPPPPPPQIYTTHLKIDLCCEECAKKVKSKLEAVKGVDEVTVDQKIKKVTIKGKLQPKEALDTVSKELGIFGPAEFWPETYTTHLKFDLCCEECAKKVKSKLEAVKGVDEVIVDHKVDKVTIKGKLKPKEALEAALKIGTTPAFWPEETKEKKEEKPREEPKKEDKPAEAKKEDKPADAKKEDKPKEESKKEDKPAEAKKEEKAQIPANTAVAAPAKTMKKDEFNTGQIFVYTTNDCYETWPNYEETGAASTVEVLAADIEPKQLASRDLNAVAPLPNFNHVKRVRRMPKERGGVDLPIILCAQRDGPVKYVHELVDKHGLQIFTVKLTNATVIVDPALGQVIASGYQVLSAG